MCGALLRLLRGLHERASVEKFQIVPTSILGHWDSFTSEPHTTHTLLISLVTHVGVVQWSLLHQSPAAPSLHTLTLTLLHTLLTYKLRPPSHDLSHASFSDTLTSLLDPREPSHSETETNGEKSDSLRGLSGGDLCATLLEVYEGSEVRLTRQKGCGLGAGLVSMVLCVLLAVSQSAKQTALKGMVLSYM